MRVPARELVSGVWDEESEALVGRLRPLVRDVFYVELDQLAMPDVVAFLRWAVPKLEGTEWESLLLEVERGVPIANGLARWTGKVVSLEYPGRQLWD